MRRKHEARPDSAEKPVRDIGVVHPRRTTHDSGGTQPVEGVEPGEGHSRYAAAMRLTLICRSKSRDWARSKAICMPSHVSGVEPKAFDSR